MSACATCDGFFFRGKEVIVVGGGNTAVEEALFLTNFASGTIVHRRDHFRAERILQERLFKHPKIKFIWDSAIDEICGTDNPGKVTHIRLKNVKSGTLTELPARRRLHCDRPCAGDPVDPWPDQAETIRLCRSGAELDRDLVPGVFAAGDVADETYRQAVMAAGLGCMAALEAERFLALRASDGAAAA